MVTRNISPGQFASKDPRGIRFVSRIPCLACDDGVETGVFAWVDLGSGSVNNAHSGTRSKLGFVRPLAERAHVSEFCSIVPPGREVTLASGGDFYACFPDGAEKGQSVYASLIDGTPISGETPDAELTPWVVAVGCAPGGLAVISTWSK